jgi:hypothetical protein
MVMTRKYVLLQASSPSTHPDINFRHYFRTQCIYIASRSRRPPPRRSRASLLASISHPIKTFQNQDVVPPRKVSPIPDIEIIKGSTSGSDDIEEKFQQASTSGSDDIEEKFQQGSTSGSDDIIKEKSQRRSTRHSTSNPETNAVMFSSSPTPLSVPLPPSHPSSNHSLAEEASVTSDFLRQRRVLAFTGN